jgi:hypothetical protein
LLFLSTPAAAAPLALETEVEILRPSDAATRPYQNFGWEVDRAPGIVAVGSPAAYETDLFFRTGAAYVFEREGDAWRETRLVPADAEQNDLIGESIAIMGDRVLVGSYLHDGRGFNSGAVWVYRREESGWVEETKLLGSDVVAHDGFAFDIAVQDDQALIAAYQHDGSNGFDSGAVYAFRHDGTQWLETQKITPSDAQPNDRFGNGVAISGDIAVIGSRAIWDPWIPSRGVAYVFRYDGSQWAQEARLAPIRSISGFGQPNTIGISGDRILLGAPQDPTLGSEAGSATVFHYDGAQWVREATLFASDGSAGEAFGGRVALWGDVALVGARTVQPDASRGSIYLFRFDGDAWLEQAKLELPEREAGDSVGADLRLQDGSGTIGGDEKVYLIDFFHAVGIDIRPHQDPNRIDPFSPLPVSVAVLGSQDFDVRDIARATLRFGPAGASPLGPHFGVSFDLDRDGFRDVVSRYVSRDAGIAFGDQTACVRGETDAGIAFRGCDAIQVVPLCGAGFEVALLLPAIGWLGRRERRT